MLIRPRAVVILGCGQVAAILSEWAAPGTWLIAPLQTNRQPDFKYRGSLVIGVNDIVGGVADELPECCRLGLSKQFFHLLEEGGYMGTSDDWGPCCDGCPWFNQPHKPCHACKRTK